MTDTICLINVALISGCYSYKEKVLNHTKIRSLTFNSATKNSRSESLFPLHEIWYGYADNWVILLVFWFKTWLFINWTNTNKFKYPFQNIFFFSLENLVTGCTVTVYSAEITGHMTAIQSKNAVCAFIKHSR